MNSSEITITITACFLLLVFIKLAWLKGYKAGHDWVLRHHDVEWKPHCEACGKLFGEDEEMRTDSDGVEFCVPCWDGWTKEETITN